MLEGIISHPDNWSHNPHDLPWDDGFIGEIDDKFQHFQTIFHDIVVPIGQPLN